MGMSPDEIVSEYPSVTLAEVHAALAYYYENRERIDGDIEAAKRYAEEMRARAVPAPGKAAAKEGRCPGRSASTWMKTAPRPSPAD
jgi:Protein of unknown function (DUF433)